MNIAFTICSNNYLGQAKTLGDSLLRQSPDWLFFICLCDKKHPDVDYAALSPIRVIEAADLGIIAFDDMCGRYNIIELNTAIKPFAFSYFYGAYSDAKRVVYFDPDISIYAPLTAVTDELSTNAALLTPHILSPLDPDGKTPSEDTFALFGIYNLGFLATARDERLWPFLEWWKQRLENNCYMRQEKGIFVDQLPMNLAPLFFEGFRISRHPGMNMAPWNLHERHLSLRNGVYFVNEDFPLIFYHFSSFKPERVLPGTSCADYARGPATGQDAFLALNKDYASRLLANGHMALSSIPCRYGLRRPSRKKTIGEKFIRSIKKRLYMKIE